MAVRIFDKYTFYHIPKTGGMAVRDFLARMDVNKKEIESELSITGIKKAKASLRIHCCPLHIKDHDPDYSFTAVRHPLRWYESLYKSKRSKEKSYFVNNWKPVTTFEEFVSQILNIHPDGYVSALYSRFVPFCKHILHTENLSDELRELFHDWGFSDIPELRRKNESENVPCTLPDALKEKLLTIESGIINYLGYSE